MNIENKNVLDPKSEETFHSGFIAILGAPNVGKSTLLNRVLGQKISIVAARPQTTRERILGIRHEPGVQMVFLDTPGVHSHVDKALNRYMAGQWESALADADIVVWVCDAPLDLKKFDPLGLGDLIEKSGKRAMVAINKVDLVNKPDLLTLMERFGQMSFVQSIFAISALNGSGVEDLVQAISEGLPIGPAFYPEDQVTDLPMRFLAREIVRESVFRHTKREVPYSTAVIIDQFEENPKKKLYVIHASVYVERKSQKGILIGDGGQMIKRIGQTARKELETQFGVRVYLDLRVAVESDWSTSPKGLRRLGYL